MTVSELDRWDYNDREVLYNDSPGIAEEGWKPADPVLLILTIRSLIEERDRLRELLRDVRDEYDRHPDYDWDIDFAREVDRALDEG